MKKVGNFLYENEADKQYLLFESDGDTPRCFTVVKYKAYNAGGIIGTEKNGVAILDNGTEQDNLMFVVASDIHKGQPSRAQSELDEISKMNWKEFSEYLRELPEYRNNVEDIDDEEEYPYEGNAINLYAMNILSLKDEKDIRTQEMIDITNLEDYGLEFAPIGRIGMITELMNHEVHRDGSFGTFYFSWNARIYSNDDSGTKGDSEVDPHFDEKWEEYFSENGERIWNNITEDMARYYLEGEYTTYPGDDLGDYQFGLQGNSGGNLALREVDGINLGFDSISSIQDNLNSLTDEELLKVYKAVKSLDFAVTPDNIAKEFEYKLNDYRSRIEDDWRKELTTGLN